MHVDAHQTGALQDYLRRRGWLDTEETISAVEKPGEGNMNYTLRVITPLRTLIVKQSRAYVEKYPTIAAPADRAVLEGRFYQQAEAIPELAGQMPALMGIDPENNLLVLSDLGQSRDFTFLYRPDQQLSEADAQALTAWLGELHREFMTPTPDPAFANHALRTLNHEHIFQYPFNENNGFDLNAVQPGLTDLAQPYQGDARLKETIRQLGEVYLSDAPANKPVTLLHGDYYPGSWLQTPNGPKIIDPEFCFYGPAEFDLGVMMAHLMLAQQPQSTLKMVREGYEKPRYFDELLRQRFTGVEIMRRLIGLAQLPLSLSINQKRILLAEAHSMLS